MISALKYKPLQLRYALVFVQALLFTPIFATSSDPSLPSSAEVIQRVIQRSEKVSVTKSQYTHQKRSITQVLGEKGEVRKQSEKLYTVLLVSGLPFSRLTKVEGQSLNADELAKEDEREKLFRQKVSSVDLEKMGKEKKPLITQELVDKFSFAVRERIYLNGRRTIVLGFRGAAAKESANSVQDRILARLSGDIYIDEEEDEIVKISVALTEPISLGWVGMFGALTQCDCELQRTRLPDGTWVNVEQKIFVVGRKVFTPFRTSTKELSFDFRPDPQE